MADTPTTPSTVVRIEAALDLNLTLQQQLKQEEHKLREQLRQADIPAPPPEEYTMFLAEVQFAEGGGIYEYLIHRSVERDHWCTTGSRPEHKRFASWEKLCAWLNGTYWHANLTPLQLGEPRRFATEFTTEAPF